MHQIFRPDLVRDALSIPVALTVEHWSVSNASLTEQTTSVIVVVNYYFSYI